MAAGGSRPRTSGCATSSTRSGNLRNGIYIIMQEKVEAGAGLDAA